VTECCVTNSKVDEEDVIDLLEDIMDQEFHTVCDDNSIKEISCLLIKYLNMLKNGNLDQIGAELAQWPPCDIWIVAGRKINFVAKLDDESSSDDDEDDEMGDSMSSKAKITNNTSAPSTSGSTMQVEEQDIDPGWTVVKTKKKK
jgi:pre-rRNA-processing protein TSR2